MSNKKIIERVNKLIHLANTSEGKTRIDRDFSTKVKTMRRNGFVSQLKTLYQYFKDPNTSKAKKGLIGAGLLYFILPFDVVHDYLPVVGYIDDGVAIAYIWSKISKELENYRENTDIIDITDHVKVMDED